MFLAPDKAIVQGTCSFLPENPANPPKVITLSGSKVLFTTSSSGN